MRLRTTGTRPTVPSSLVVIRPRNTWTVCPADEPAPWAGVTTVTQS